MFVCDKKTVIYVVCPAYDRTGGLELLHQLVEALNQKGLEAYITYFNYHGGNPVNEAYQKYIREYRIFNDIEDRKGDYVIISEHQLELMDRFKNAGVIIWWLSVDNYLKVYDPCAAYRLLGVKGVLWYLKHRRWRYRISGIHDRIRYNLVQSYYAMDFLKRNHFHQIEYLSDYINTDYLHMTGIESAKRKNVVLYNPKKGKQFSNYLMSLDRSVKWIPLIGMSNEQVREHLLHSKVYVDFGNHPGKDRFPREAAVCGCIVITGKKGSAGYEKDVPIPERYKFDDHKNQGKRIIHCIKECFLYYEKAIQDFEKYRNTILGEYHQFYRDVDRLFVKEDKQVNREAK